MSSPPRTWNDVPWRTIVGTLGAVVVTGVLIQLLLLAQQVLLLLVLAGFSAIVLAPPVGWVQQRMRLPRGAAVAVVMVTTLLTVAGTIALFVLPVRSQFVQVITDLPGAVRDAARGRGPLGRMVTKLRIEKLVDDNKATLTRVAEDMQRSLPDLAKQLVAMTLELITIIVICSLMLTQSANLARASLRALPARHRDAVARVSRASAKAVSGYMIGNFVISACAGLAALAFMLITGVPNPLVLALWVAFADLIPLVGATLGAAVVVLAAFLVSPGVGIAAVVFFLLYQQFENSVLQVQVMARTVRVNPLTVLLSVLLGVDMFGLLGALLAVPVAGAITIVVKELNQHRKTPADSLVVVSERGVEVDPDQRIVDLGVGLLEDR